jgi:hypothetical protein
MHACTGRRARVRPSTVMLGQVQSRGTTADRCTAGARHAALLDALFSRDGWARVDAHLCVCACVCVDSLFKSFWASPGPTFSTPLQIALCIFLGLTKKLILATKVCNKWWKLLETHTPFLKQKAREENARVPRLGRSITQSRRTEMPRKRRCMHLPVSRFNVQDEQNRCRWEDVLD